MELLVSNLKYFSRKYLFYNTAQGQTVVRKEIEVQEIPSQSSNLTKWILLGQINHLSSQVSSVNQLYINDL